MMADRGGLERRASKRLSTRQGSAPYVKPDKSGDSSTGLTKYMGDTSLDWGGDAQRSDSLAKRGLKSFARGKAKAPQPEEIDIWKPTSDARFGITFELPEDRAIKGIVVVDIRAEGLAAHSKKLKLGDVLHVVNGQTVSTPQAAATLLREAKGVVQLVITRAGATPRQRGGDGGLSIREEEPPADEANTTVVVSCSALIQESKKIVPDDGAGLHACLDALHTKLKAKEIKSAVALKELGLLVGQTTVEQAGLVIANAQQGTLAEGWVEYYDKDNGRPCMPPFAPPGHPRTTPHDRSPLRPCTIVRPRHAEPRQPGRRLLQCAHEDHHVVQAQKREAPTAAAKEGVGPRASEKLPSKLFRGDGGGQQHVARPRRLRGDRRDANQEEDGRGSAERVPAWARPATWLGNRVAVEGTLLERQRCTNLAEDV